MNEINKKKDETFLKIKELAQTPISFTEIDGVNNSLIDEWVKKILDYLKKSTFFSEVDIFHLEKDINSSKRVFRGKEKEKTEKIKYYIYSRIMKIAVKNLQWEEN